MAVCKRSWLLQFLLFSPYILFNGVEGLNVLMSHPLYSGSHLLTMQALAAQLLERNHSVTTVMYRDSHLPTLKNTRHENFTLIEFTISNADGRLPFVTKSEEGEFTVPLDLFWQNGMDFYSMYKLMMDGAYSLANAYCTNILSDEFIRTMREAKFDIMVLDLMFNECGLSLAHSLGIPAVAYWSTFAVGQQEFTSLSEPPSFVPAFMSKLSDKMDLSERSYNYMIKVMSRLYMYFYHFTILDPILRDVNPGSPPGWKLLANINGMLINTADVLEYPRPKPPTFINIGGLQIQEVPEALPENLQAALDEADQGAILFTMGFIFDSKAVPVSMVENLMEAFSRVPQLVIFKYKLQVESIKVPDNVLLLSWVPQQSVLAHENTVLFITHCGMHGVLEAIYHGIPMVGIPVFGDQGDVMQRIRDRGIGVELGKAANPDTIYSTIVQVRDSPGFTERVQFLSQIMKDRRESPMSEAVWLVEYIARTNGSSHLRVVSGDLSLVEYYCLDVLALALALVTVCNVFALSVLSRFFRKPYTKSAEIVNNNKDKLA